MLLLNGSDPDSSFSEKDNKSTAGSDIIKFNVPMHDDDDEDDGEEEEEEEPPVLMILLIALSLANPGGGLLESGMSPKCFSFQCLFKDLRHL
jgi:hypothetical protein